MGSTTSGFVAVNTIERIFQGTYVKVSRRTTITKYSRTPKDTGSAKPEIIAIHEPETIRMPISDFLRVEEAREVKGFL
jgi:hypothetical protein